MKFSQSSAVYSNYSLLHAIEDLYLLGYDGIEIWGGRPHLYRNDLNAEMRNIMSRLEKCEMVICNLVPAQFRYPSILCSSNDVIRRDSIEYIKTAVDNAVKILSPSVSVCPGMVLWDNDLSNGWKRLKESLLELSDYALKRDVKLLIEPAHRFESNLICTVDDCIHMIEELNSDCVGILLDTGHCRINGENFAEIIPKCKEFPLHIHLDDNGGYFDDHLIPGEGSIDFRILYEELEKIGYSGFLSVELGANYAMNPHEACEKSLERIKKKFR